jgi:hypothetical protein
MVKYKNLEGTFQDTIVSSVEWALQNLNKITDEKLRNCIRKRLEKDGTIRIRRSPTADNAIPSSSDCYTDHTRGGFNKYLRILGIPSREIELCIDNLVELNQMNLLSDYILHEFAHSCGWDHGHGKGVPFPDGFPNEK